MNEKETPDGMAGRVTVVRYKLGTGEILETITCSVDVLPMLEEEGVGVLEADSSTLDTQHYVVDGRVLNRPECPAKLSGTTLTDVPAPCMIRVDGRPYDCDDSTVELDFDQPGTYQVWVEAFPYKIARFEVVSV